MEQKKPANEHLDKEIAKYRKRIEELEEFKADVLTQTQIFKLVRYVDQSLHPHFYFK
jgi:hypothetical protein